MASLTIAACRNLRLLLSIFVNPPRMTVLRNPLLLIITKSTPEGYLLKRCVNPENEAGRPLPSASRDSLLKSLTKIQYHPILHLSSGRCAEALVSQRFPAPRASRRPEKTGELSMRTELHSRTAPVMKWSAPISRLAIRQSAAMEGTRRPGFSCCCCCLISGSSRQVSVSSSNL